MMKPETQADSQELTALCENIRRLSSAGEYRRGKKMVFEAMGKFPDAAQPHNLLGLLLEQEGDHVSAIKHFRAAYALNPTYRPARQNLEHYGTFYSDGICAFDESDCPQEENRDIRISYDAHGVGHIERKA